jgi:hypothetical protein
VAPGVFKIPFGREVPSPEAERAVLGPTTAARALFPGGVLVNVRCRALAVPWHGPMARRPAIRSTAAAIRRRAGMWSAVRARAAS